MKKMIEKISERLGIKYNMEAGSDVYADGAIPGDVGSAEDYQLGPNDGVRVDPMPITKESDITIAYDGLLAKSGAGTVFLHVGSGPGEWKNVTDLPMEQNQSGEWTASVHADEGGTLEFCFHDGHGHWDNNSGVNWSVTVHDGGFPH